MLRLQRAAQRDREPGNKILQGGLIAILAVVGLIVVISLGVALFGPPEPGAPLVRQDELAGAADARSVSARGKAVEGARFTEVRPDSGANVWTEIEVKADDYSDPAIIDKVAHLLKGLATEIRAGNLSPGRDAKYVQALVFVNSPDDPKQKLGGIRFPLADFVNAGGNLEAADDVQLRSYGAAQSWCADDAHRISAFCAAFEAGAI